MVNYDPQNTILRKLVKDLQVLSTGFYNKDNAKHGLEVKVAYGMITE